MGNNRQDEHDRPDPQFGGGMKSFSWLWILLALALVGWNLWAFLAPATTLGSVEIPYSTFLEQVEAGNVKSVEIKGTHIRGIFREPQDLPGEPAPGESQSGPRATPGRQADFTTTFPEAISDSGLIPLLRQGKGRIVMMSSIAGRSSTPLLGLYAASKHALEAITDALRLELHPWGIHVSSIQPGTIATPIWGKALSFAQDVLPTYPPTALEFYGPLVEAMFKSLAKTKGIPAEAVAEVVFHALTASTPKTRYVVGQDAKIRMWIERLPDRLRDRVMLGQMPKYGG